MCRFEQRAGIEFLGTDNIKPVDRFMDTIALGLR